MATYRYTYPSVLESEDMMLDDLLPILEKEVADGGLRQRASLVISEAFVNALRHGNRMDSAKKVILRLAISEDRLSADIIDQGEGRWKGEPLGDLPGPMAENGRGITLMKHYADVVEFLTTETGGLKVSITIESEGEKIKKSQ